MSEDQEFDLPEPIPPALFRHQASDLSGALDYQVPDRLSEIRQSLEVLEPDAWYTSTIRFLVDRLDQTQAQLGLALRTRNEDRIRSFELEGRLAQCQTDLEARTQEARDWYNWWLHGPEGDRQHLEDRLAEANQHIQNLVKNSGPTYTGHEFRCEQCWQIGQETGDQDQIRHDQDCAWARAKEWVDKP